MSLQTFLKKAVFLGWQLDFKAKGEFYVSCLCPIKYKAATIKADVEDIQLEIENREPRLSGIFKNWV